MTDTGLSLANPPIIEAVVDIHCDLPPSIVPAEIYERAKELFRDAYPKARRQVIEQIELRKEARKPVEHSIREQIGALQFRTEDEKQLVQIRPEGYSFNRLAPYGSLDDYLPEIERTWTIFRELTEPVQIRRVGLRFINRILLPMVEGRVKLNEYLRISRPLLDEDTLEFAGFVNQHSANETSTGNRVNMTLVAQPPEGDRLPVIFDINAFNLEPRAPDDWEGIRETISSLRRLKNRVFKRTLTKQCLNLFR